MNGYLSRVLKLHEGRPVEQRALNEIGDTLLNAEQPQKALKFYEQALAGYKAAGDPQLQAVTLYRIGSLAEKEAEDDRYNGGSNSPAMLALANSADNRALESYRQAFEAYGKALDAGSTPSLEILFKIGSFAVARSDYEFAHQVFVKAGGLSVRQGGVNKYTARALREFGQLFYLQNNLAMAHHYYEQALGKYHQVRANAARGNDTALVKDASEEIEQLNNDIRSVEQKQQQQEATSPPKP
jgi:tetratricopeptide (TPR) repeat protein